MRTDHLSSELASLAGTLARHVAGGHVMMPGALAPIAQVLRSLTAEAVALEVRAGELEEVARDLDALPLPQARPAGRDAVLAVPGTNVVVLPSSAWGRS